MELDSLLGKHASSKGESLLIARVGTDFREHYSNGSTQISPPEFPSTLGCVALQRDSAIWCEMKRLYVLKDTRGERLSETLVEAILEQVRALWVRTHLDTLPEMTAARRLSPKYGVVDIAP
ncbi:hypothetical protein PDIG_17170 [Penicillium digitatum PHI26]|uniref:N-acetyltransferase domain-containing protein n=2 Tax=Penicillium digitatum TaxID=36651 RepID=K9GQR1_PEND2|nr:hypothetical protein PDIP_55070 [Penicillium digitatum Pd1]EKV11686.1 hypothetical protein PDIP_55070 [Penicillium digitatum Pd1]EKV17003.1 hypothetical protein PDIG_17170 [Penicillium digitatum PHI26]